MIIKLFQLLKFSITLRYTDDLIKSDLIKVLNNHQSLYKQISQYLI